MGEAFEGRWANGGGDRHAAVRPAVSRGLVAVRAVATPANLSLGLAVAVGWLALVSWTGVGPDGWQARSCADLDLGRTACGAIRPSKDQSRLAPHAQTAGSAR